MASLYNWLHNSLVRAADRHGVALPPFFQPRDRGNNEGEWRSTRSNISEEDIIDTNDPEVQQAATKIQAAFRGSQARKTLTTTMQASAKSDAVESPTEEIDIDLTDPEVNQAAAKIQASFRGHKVRREMKKPPPEEKQEDLITNVPKEEEDEVVDIDLSDPDVQKAATKIQASFRGRLVRKQTGEQK